MLTGNAGADTFVFNAALVATNIDTLTDFAAGSDRLWLDDAIFTALNGQTTVSASQFSAGAGVSSAADADDYLLYNTSTGALYYDADGSASTYSAQQFATLQNLAALTAASFTVV